MIKSSSVKPLATLLLLTGVASGLLACATTESDKMAAAPTVDGEVTVPAGYQKWARFVPTVDKPNGQVRELYINDIGLKAENGDAFPPGTITVMELYAPKKDSDGNPVKNDNGRFMKDKLAKVFVMAKGDGWGSSLPSGVIPNGDWLYGAYLADGTTPATQDFAACRGCHAPLTDKDFIHRYDEHFAQK